MTASLFVLILTSFGKIYAKKFSHPKLNKNNKKRNKTSWLKMLFNSQGSMCFQKGYRYYKTYNFNAVIWTNKWIFIFLFSFFCSNRVTFFLFLHHLCAVAKRTLRSTELAGVCLRQWKEVSEANCEQKK